MRNNQEKRGIQQESTDAILEYCRTGGLEDRLAHLLRHVSRGFRRSLEFRLSQHNIAFGHWVFLRILWQMDGLSQRELSIQAGVMEPTTHTAILRMEGLGLLKRRHVKGNRKRMHVFLTKKGWKLESRLIPLAQEINSLAVCGIKDKDVDKMRSMLLRMIKNLAEDERSACLAGHKISSTRSHARRKS